ncbi:MAG TPA: DUF3566 domain-containing protein [Actinomycetota bacterium]|nr:DUF3566 domain-containing protein [Actinomycetota bacterium]
MSPDVQPAGALFDPFTAPLPSERARERGGRGETGERARTRPERGARPRSDTTAELAGVDAPADAPARRSVLDDVGRPGGRHSRRGPKTRPALRRVKRTLKRVDPLSVLKLSLFYYAFALVVWLLLVAVAFWAIQSTGIFEQIERLSEAFAAEIQLDITLGLVEKWAFLIGLTFMVVGSLVNAFLAFLYNIAADIVGGLELTFVERDLGS